MAKFPQSIGFIGLGVMGMPMAENLRQKLDSSAKMFVFDINTQAVNEFCTRFEGNVHACGSAKEVTDKVELLISMVPEGAHVRSVYLDTVGGVLAANVKDKILLDCSTIDTTTSEAVLDKVRSTGLNASFYDAPVSGGSLGAQKASLTFMLGCSETDKNYDLLRSLLSFMGKSIFACGGPTLGLKAKLCNNYCSGLIAVATAEAMNIGMRSGLRPDVLAKVFSTGTAQSTINDRWNPVPDICPDAPSSHDYQGGFRVELMKKDFALAVETAHKVDARLALGDAGLKIYTDASEDPNCRGRDSRVVFRYLGGDENWASSVG